MLGSGIPAPPSCHKACKALACHETILNTTTFVEFRNCFRRIQKLVLRNYAHHLMCSPAQRGRGRGDKLRWVGAWTFDVTKGSFSYQSSPCFSKHVLQSGVGLCIEFGFSRRVSVRQGAPPPWIKSPLRRRGLGANLEMFGQFLRHVSLHSVPRSNLNSNSN